MSIVAGVKVSSRPQVELGSVWQREDGRKVKVEEVKVFSGRARKFLLAPCDGEKGKRSWKWECYILKELMLVSGADRV